MSEVSVPKVRIDLVIAALYLITAIVKLVTKLLKRTISPKPVFDLGLTFAAKVSNAPACHLSINNGFFINSK